MLYRNNQKTMNKEFLISDSALRRKTIFSFIVFIVMLVAAVLLWKWLYSQPKDNATPAPLRKVLHANERFFNNFFSNQHLSRTYDVSRAVKKVRVNGKVGMSADFD